MTQESTEESIKAAHVFSIAVTLVSSAFLVGFSSNDCVLHNLWLSLLGVWTKASLYNRGLRNSPRESLSAREGCERFKPIPALQWLPHAASKNLPIERGAGWPVTNSLEGSLLVDQRCQFLWEASL